mgnify:CR=1 FL=1
MSRRERMERRLERRLNWGNRATAEAEHRSQAASAAVEGIPFGQPILVGHHSERRHRRALERSDRNMTAACAADARSQRHHQVASTLAARLESTVFSDDPDALEALQEKIIKLEGKRDAIKAVNSAWRKAGKPKADDQEGWTRVAVTLGVELQVLASARLNQARDFMDRGPYPTYVSTNLGANIRRCQERMKSIQTRAERQAKATAAGGVVLTSHEGGYLEVTFAEKPSRNVLERLKAANFHWSNGSWFGKSSDDILTYLKVER